MVTAVFRPISTVLIRHIVRWAFACFVVMGCVHAALEFRVGKAEFAETVAGISESSVPLLSVSLWDIELEVVDKQMALIARRPEVGFVSLATLTGKTFEAGDSALRNSSMARHVEIPSPKGAGKLGSLLIVGNEAYLYRKIAWAIAQLLLGYLVFVAAICLVVAVVLRRELQRPLAQLARFASEMAPGEIAAPVQVARVERSYTDEVDQLADGFHQLQNTVARHVANLDALVAERTGELALHNLILDQINQMKPLHSVLDTLARQIDLAHAGARSAVLLLDRDGKRLRLGVAPAMPDFFHRAMDDIEIGAQADPCATAVVRRECVVVQLLDDQTVGSGYADLARRVGFVGCWAQPVSDTAGQVLGVVALYLPMVGPPTPAEVSSMQRYARLALLAIERKRVEERLKTITRAVDQSPVSIVISDPQGVIQYVNPKFEELTGYQSHEAVGQNPRILSSHEKSIDEYREMWSVLLSGRTWTGEFHNRRKDGTLFWEHASISPITDEQGVLIHFVAVKEDITQDRAVALELRQAKRLAEAANSAKSQFLATMSHEIRTPLNGILGMAQLLLMADVTDAQRETYTRTILASGQTLLTLLNDILDISKVEAGKLELTNEVFDPEQLVDVTRNLFVQLAQAKGLSLQARWLGPKGQRYTSDASRLRQMLSNLIGNAIKFTAQGFVRVDVTEVSDEGDHSVLEFSATDSGVGVPHDKQRLLFNPFTQADSSTTREFGGTGLGLSIIRSLAELMGGSVGLESQMGAGSRFWFRVRVAKVPHGEDSRRMLRSPVIAQALAHRADPMPGLVLVVEDNAINRLVVEGMLGKLGARFKSVEDGQLALKAVQDGLQPDLVLMDMQMPVMDGITATRHIREWERQTGRAATPIVALTAGAFETDRDSCLAAGMDDFMTKPIHVKDLGALLDKWLFQTGQR